MNHMPHPQTADSHAEEGYFLVGLVVVCFLLLLVLAVAAPRVAKQLERDREVEAEHRAQEYVRAIQLYYRKNGRYPTSLDQLTGSTGSGFSSALNVKYLRQRYKDPLTRDEFVLIHQGEAKTEVKGFFGEPLQGVAAGNLGAVAGSVSNLNGPAGPVSGTQSPTSAGGASSGFSLGNSFGSGTSAFGGATQNTGSPSAQGSASPVPTSSSPVNAGPGGTATPGSATGTPGSNAPGSTDATSFQGSKGAIIGVASSAKGHGLVEWNGSENIEQWEFLYDPRVELLKAKVSIFGGSPAASGAGSLGNGFQPANGTTGFGQSGSSNGPAGGSGFGSSQDFGSANPAPGTNSSGVGSTPPNGTSAPAVPPATPQP